MHECEHEAWESQEIDQPMTTTSAHGISARTALCGVVLHPAGHTRSPAMHNAAFVTLGLDAVYHAFDVAPNALPDAIRGMRALGLRQLAVSLPHKQAVMAHLDRIDETARTIGAVNTVTREGDQLIGSNTDWSGAMRALERETTIAGKCAVVLGAGGAARAVVYGLVQGGAQVIVLNRTESKAEALVSELGGLDAGPLSRLGDLTHDILVNTTSVGLRSDESPVPSEQLRAASVVMDAVYDPAQTRLLKDAFAADARPLGGKWMLVYQAAEQLQRWSGREAPIETMADAFDAAGR
jgi:shikimate dehydrogenase